MNQRAIFITGGAGGMGVATGKRFADAGWKVGLFDLNQQALDEAKSAVDGGAVMTGVLDVTSTASFTQAVSDFSHFSGGRMDLLFNNAGIAPGGLLEDMSEATIKSILEVNVMGVIHGIRAALPLLKVTDNALSMSTSSSVATFGHAKRAVYTASKFAVKGLTEAMSLELEAYGIRSADVLPGCIDTPMLREETAKGAGRPFELSMLDGLPQSGAYRLMPATAIAEAVWSAYHDSDQIHFYVPEEVGDTDRVKALDIQAARAEIKSFLYRG